jgi:hypothetical protein
MENTINSLTPTEQEAFENCFENVGLKVDSNSSILREESYEETVISVAAKGEILMHHGLQNNEDNTLYEDEENGLFVNLYGYLDGRLLLEITE